MKKDITRAIINATVDRGLREINEDPRRSIRKLADLGRHFHKGRFMQPVYDIFQDLLKNDDSPYYSAVEHLLQHTSRKNLKDFGINVGYSSLTKGAKKIRDIQDTKGYLVPWAVSIRLDSTITDGLSPADVFQLIAESKKLGVYSYMIRLENNIKYLEEITKLALSYSDCAFLIVLPDCELSDEDIENLASCSNTLIFLHSSGEHCDSNALALRRKKLWYGTYEYYDDTNYKTVLTPDTAYDYISQESAFFLLISKDGTSIEVIREQAITIKKLRMQPCAPLFPFDLYGDGLNIQKLAAGNSCFFEILPDGNYYTDRGFFKKNEGLPNLEQAFSTIFK